MWATSSAFVDRHTYSLPSVSSSNIPPPHVSRALGMQLNFFAACWECPSHRCGSSLQVCSGCGLQVSPEERVERKELLVVGILTLQQ